MVSHILKNVRLVCNELHYQVYAYNTIVVHFCVQFMHKITKNHIFEYNLVSVVVKA